MTKIFNKLLVGVAATMLLSTLAIGFNVCSKDVKAEEANAITDNWTNAAPSYEPNDAVITDTTFESTANSISANISITGWQARWVAEETPADDAIVLDDNIWGEKPYQITSTNKAKIVPGNTYKLKFTVENGMMAADSQTPTEKNITITVNSGIEGDTDNTFLFETITVPASATKEFEFDIPISSNYGSDDVQIQFAYGSYFYSYTLTEAVKAGTVSEEDAKACKYAYAYGTTENVNAHGTLKFTDISLMGEKFTQSVIPDKPVVVPATETTTKATATTTKAATKKLTKVKKLKVKNTKKGTIKITWKKVAKAKKYTVKVGKKTYTVKKAKLTVKKLKKGKKYTVKVRATAAGYKVAAWTKKTIKIRK